MSPVPIGSPLGRGQDIEGGIGFAPGVPRDRRREWRLPSTESSVTVLRRGLAAFLRGTELSGEELYDLLLAACEAASNAVEHAQNPSEPFFDVLTEVDEDQVCVTVYDHGQWRNGIAGAHRGRGLGMMRVLADTSVVTGPEGTTVTLRGRRSGARPPNGDGGPPGGAHDGGRPPPEPVPA